MPHKILYLLLLTLMGLQAGDYFQQKVAYTIDVRLNVATQTYSGTETVVYTNNAPTSLNKILFHLYPNAYSDDHTPFARQQERFGNSRFHFSNPKERGYLKLISVNSKGRSLKVVVKDNAPDEVSVLLDKPLPPGGQLTLQLSFKGKFPKVFSRMGHVSGRYYAATQWYPKVVVYDRNGWHPDSYLDMGEFYGEFGDFDVRITLPRNYIIDATGMLQDNPAEQAFIDSIAALTRHLVNLKDADRREEEIKKWQKQHRARTDTTDLKTVRFTAHNVHDFAWFAGEDYMIHKKIQPGGVLTHVLVLPKNAYDWKDVPMYVTRTLAFYGKRVGPYQYPKASVVDGSLEAGGGMEYPMITIISSGYQKWNRLLEMVVAHEVGHNWFYGMLGSDERASTFMDEGNNAFTEWKYMEHYYGSRNMTQFDSLFGKWNTLSDAGEFDVNYLTYGTLVWQQRDLPLNLRAEKYTRSAYGGINYAKSAFMLRALEWSITEPVFIKAMHTYFDEWNGRHPSVDDFWEVFSRVSGEDLRVFRQEWMATTHYNDFTVANVETKKDENGYQTMVWPENIGTMAPLPVPVYLITVGNDTLESRWDGRAEHPVVFRHQKPVKEAGVNLKHIIFEKSYLNNSTRFPWEMRFADVIPSFTTYRGTYMPYVYFDEAKDKTRLGVMAWIGNPILMQHFLTAKVYYGTGSGQTSYATSYTNRLPGFIGSYSDIYGRFIHTDGMRAATASLKMAFLDRYDSQKLNEVTARADYVDLYDTDYNEPGIYDKSRYATWGIRARTARRRMLYSWQAHAAIEKGLGLGADEVNFTKWQVASDFTWKWMRWLAVSWDMFAGSVSGNHVPLQEMIFAGGGVDPKHEQFTPAYRGRSAPLRGYTYLNGMNMPGHSGSQGVYMQDRSGLATGLRLNFPMGLSVYGRVGTLADTPGRLTESSVLSEYGVGLNWNQLRFIFPLYVPNPPGGGKAFDFRMLFNVNMNFSIGG
ncbi:MAG: M1 family peptidase [Calditrichaeota bacterium]|nr:MAG: M1 family peptidase [Calditrichota bacterium]